AGRDRPGERDRARDRRQERACGPRRAHRQQRGGEPQGRRGLLHPRRDRDRAERRGGARRHGDLAVADLVDLAVALARDPFAVAAIVQVEVLERLGVRRLAPVGLVQDLALGQLGLVHLAQLGDPRLLLLAESALRDALRAVLLLEALQDQLVRGLGLVFFAHMRLNSSIPFWSERCCLMKGTIFVSRSSISCERLSTSAAFSCGTTTTPSSPARMMSPGAIVTPPHSTGMSLAALAKRPTAVAGVTERAEIGRFGGRRSGG